MSRRTLSYYALFSLILTMILGCIFGPSTAYAAEPNGQEEVEAAFDLEQYLPQSKTIFLANGEEAEIGIRPVPTIRCGIRTIAMRLVTGRFTTTPPSSIAIFI